MDSAIRQIISIGGGYVVDSPSESKTAIHEYLLNLVPRSKDIDFKPKICCLDTSDGVCYSFKPDEFKKHFEEAGAIVSFIKIGMRIDIEAITSELLNCHIIYTEGGNSISIMAIWKTWGLDLILRKAYAKGIILAGNNFGGSCWFEHFVTASRKDLSIIDGLGILPGTCCNHYNSPLRQDYCLNEVKHGLIRNGYGISQYTAVHFINEKFERGLSWKTLKTPNPNTSTSLYKFGDGEIKPITCELIECPIVDSCNIV